MQKLGRGTTGANKGPEAIFKALKTDIKPIAIPVEEFNTAKNEDTLKAHDVISTYTKTTKRPFLTLGGDHGITYPIIRGLAQQMDGNMGLIYIDAHYDMRPWEPEGLISSGNSFARIINDPAVKIKGENMVAIGVIPGDTEILKFMDAFAKKNGVTVFYQDQVNSSTAKGIMEKALKIAGNGTKGIYLSIDMDALDVNKYAPGVSCFVKKGLELPDVITMVSMGEFCGADIVEVSIREKTWTGELDPKGAEKLAATAITATEIIKHIHLK